MVDHKPGLTAINADVLSGDETGFVGCQEQHHVGDVQRIAYTACRLLDGIGTFSGLPSLHPAALFS